MADVYEIGFEGVKDSGTFVIDDTTATAIGTSLDAEVNKAYAISGDKTVGYGSSGDPVFGIVTKVEKYSANSTVLVATLKLTGMKENVPTTSTTADLPVAGKGCSVDGAGKLIVTATNATTDVIGRARAFSVVAATHLATIQL